MKSEKHRCGECGKVVPLRREATRLVLAGKWAATVDSLVYDCDCGEGLIREDIEGLFREIALLVVRKDTRLAPEEIRFLRDYLVLEAKELGTRLGVTAVQISRWENGAAVMSQPADRLLRMLVADELGLKYGAKDLQRIGDKLPSGPMRGVSAKRKAARWVVAAHGRQHDRILRPAV
jgi:putative zinc finger/helix-turn-helix YgiT family protein